MNFDVDAPYILILLYTQPGKLTRPGIELGPATRETMMLPSITAVLYLLVQYYLKILLVYNFLVMAGGSSGKRLLRPGFEPEIWKFTPSCPV